MYLSTPLLTTAGSKLYDTNSNQAGCGSAYDVKIYAETCT